MKFTVNSKTLNEAIGLVSKVQNANSSIPILECILLDIKGDSMTILCSDTENFVSETISVVESDADVCFALRKDMAATLKSIPDQPIAFTLEPQGDTFSLTIGYNNGQFDLTAWSAECYPLPLDLTGDTCTSINISTAALLAGITHTRPFIKKEKDSVKPTITGVYLDMQPYGMICVGTDGQGRLSKHWFKDMGSDMPFGCIFSDKALGFITTILSKSDEEEVAFTFNGRDYRIEAGAYKFTSRMIEGKYPNYNSVIPAECISEADVSVKDMLGAISRVSQFSASEFCIELSIDSDHIDIAARDLMYAINAKESVSCDYKGEPLRIYVNHAFLADILNNIKAISDNATFKFIDGVRPILITPSDKDEHEELIFLCMPMSGETY